MLYQTICILLLILLIYLYWIIDHMKKSNIMNEALWVKSNSKEENFNQLRKGIKELKETLHKQTNIQNEKLYKLSNITQYLENKLNVIRKKMVEYENKLNQLEDGKE